MNQRIIKKYPNRRLYDTELSHYITLSEVKQLIIDCVDLKVIDAKTEEDLTNATLLQIILEQEDSQSPLFTRNMLENFIRFYGHSMQSSISQYLQQSMDYFMNQSTQLKNNMDQLLGNTNPLQYISQLTQKNWEMWQSISSEFLKQQSAPFSSSPQTEEKEVDDKNNK